MPSQDKQRHPDSGDLKPVSRVVRGLRSRDTFTIGTNNRASSPQGREGVQLDVAVDNDRFTTCLGDIVNRRTRSEQARPATDDTANDAHAAIGRLFEAQEEISRRIAQSLHDEASQMLAIVYLELASIARKSPAPTSDRIDRVIELLDAMCEQIRGLSHELHPMVLEQHGLQPALNQLAKGVSKRSGLEVKVDCGVTDLPPAIEVAVYRVVQEALTNVMRHAAASMVEVRVWRTDERIHCSVRDDGIGYQPAKQESEGGCGLGLVGIYERVDSLGGECHILSGNRKGMELKMGIPL